jgi:hypothetical protein
MSVVEVGFGCYVDAAEGGIGGERYAFAEGYQSPETNGRNQDVMSAGVGYLAMASTVQEQAAG